MFVTEFTVRNVKCFDDATLRFGRPPEGAGRCGGWHVILGENGTGKSTLLKALALTLIGPAHANRLGLNTRTWPRLAEGGGTANMEAKILPDAHDLDGASGRRPSILRCGLRLSGLSFEPSENWVSLSEGLWSDVQDGYFAAAYGPFRRISPEHGARRLTEPKEDRVASLFMEDLDFQESLAWLDGLPRTPSDVDRCPELMGCITFQDVADMLTAEFLRSNAGGHTEWATIVAEPGAEGRVGALPRSRAPRGSGRGGVSGEFLALWDLGDGVRSVLALVVDLLRLLDAARPRDAGSPELRLAALHQTSGIVIIDEPDAHVHPRWQRELGFALKRLFPNLQFIVSTHSPFICQAAEDGSISVLQRQRQGHVTVVADIPSVQGWQAGQILTDLFGLNSTRDRGTADLIREYDELAAKCLDTRLTATENQRYEELEQALRKRLGPAGDSPEERVLFKKMERYMQHGQGDE